MLYAVGKPVYHRESFYNNGGWMRDPNPVLDKDAEKYYVTREDDPARLYQYDNKTYFKKDVESK